MLAYDSFTISGNGLYCNISPCGQFDRSSNIMYLFSNILTSNFSIQGNIEGGRTSLWIRAWLQEQLFILGCFLQGDAGKVLFVAILVLSTFCVGLKSAQIHSRVDQLWVQGKLIFEKTIFIFLSLRLLKRMFYQLYVTEWMRNTL